MEDRAESGRWWPWVLALLLLLLLAWGMSRVLGERDADVQVEEAVPTTG